MRVYTQIVKHCSAGELLSIFVEFVASYQNLQCLAIVWIAYDGLVDYGVKAYYRIRHSKNEFAKGRNHINGKNFFASFHSQLQAEWVMQSIDLLNAKESKKIIFASFKRNRI